MVTELVQYLGFLTILEHQKHGLIGGYLVLNHAGRPVEFHCTSPVRPNRAQEILYGATLEPFLYGEQIAQTLVQRAKIKPMVLLTDTPSVLAVQDFLEIPVVLVGIKRQKQTELKLHHESQNENWQENESTQKNISNVPQKYMSITKNIENVPGIIATRWEEQEISENTLAIPSLTKCPVSQTRDFLETIAHAIDYEEPFVRIRLAVEEAQKAA